MTAVPGSAQDRPDDARPEPAPSRFSELPPAIDPDDLVEEVPPVRTAGEPPVPEDPNHYWG